MERTKSNGKKHRRRSCWDRIRRWALEQQRQRRKKRKNPAVAVLLQILAMFAVVFGRMPIPVLDLRPTPRPKPKRHRRPEVTPAGHQPDGYTRYTEAGWPRRYGSTMPPFSTMLRHIRGGSKVRRDDAIDVLRRKADPEVLPWLDSIVERGEWGDLAVTIRPGQDDDTTHIAMLEAAIVWAMAEREKEIIVVPEPDGADGPDDDGGSGGSVGAAAPPYPT